jgi:hypothetical protein
LFADGFSEFTLDVLDGCYYDLHIFLANPYGDLLFMTGSIFSWSAFIVASIFLGPALVMALISDLIAVGLVNRCSIIWSISAVQQYNSTTIQSNPAPLTPVVT